VDSLPPAKEAPVAAREAIEWVEKSLGENPRIAEDARKLKQILKTDLALLKPLPPAVAMITTGQSIRRPCPARSRPWAYIFTHPA
jgi:hypothetical protein